MNILVLGGGGREHAITWALAKSARTDELFVAPGNGGTSDIAQNVAGLNAEDGEAVLAFVQQHVRLQSDRLWLEPDFTGQRAGERSISFSLNSCAGVLLWLLLRLLHRLWKDPQLQPAHTS